MKKIKYFVLSIIILFLLYFVYLIVYNTMEPKVYDFMMKYVTTSKFLIGTEEKPLFKDSKKKVLGSNDIILIVIDDKTVEKYRWPWKRELFCKIFNYFNDYAKPKVIVHDAILSTLDTDNPESDKKFFNDLQRIDNLIEGFYAEKHVWTDREFGEKYDKKFVEKFALKNIDNQNTTVRDIYKSVIPFPEPYFNAIKKIGFVNTQSGSIKDFGNLSDDVIRTTDYVITYNNQVYPSLALHTFLEFYDYPKMILKDKSIEFPEFNYKINQISTYSRQYVPLKFYKAPLYRLNGDIYEEEYTHSMISAYLIMESYDDIINGKKPKVDPKIFDGKIVLIGANVTISEGLHDIKSSPILTNHPGVDIQATAIDNIIHNNFMKLIPDRFNILITILGMFLVYYLIRAYELIKALSLTLTTIILYIFICIICFYNSIVINVATPVVMFVVTMIIAYVHRYLIESKNKQKVEKALGKYMSEDVMKRVIQNIDNLGLGGKKSVVTVLFSDIRGFTSLSEKMSAEEVTEILNEYFSDMEPIVRKHNGIINKFIGDAIMAIFGEPIQSENHPKDAVKCAYEMIEKVNELQEKWNLEGKPKIEIGIGINTGEVFVGNIGTENRMEYTVIGDTVNLASRLENYNKTCNTRILISSATYEYTKDITQTRKIPNVEIRGKAGFIDIYELISVIE